MSKPGNSSNEGSYGSQGEFYQSNGSGYKSNYNKNKGKGKQYYNSQSQFGNAKSGNFSNNAPGILIMEEELPALHSQCTWSLVPLPTNKNLLDVKNVFLHGILQEEVYMSQPPGFVNSQQLSHHVGTPVVILLLYIVNIIITGNDTTAITNVILSLAQEFDIKDLGPLHYFLGIQITHSATGLFLSHSKYVTDLLNKTDMALSKSCHTLCLPYNRLLKDDGKPFHNPTLYRSEVGALQYLTFTTPEIALSIHQVYQFMHYPMESHFIAVNRFLIYLKGTMDYGIQFSKGDLDLHAFSDADWVGDPKNRRSTTGFVVYLGSNPISWSSKKQNTVSKSSTEAEYLDIFFTATEID
ncbi:unnamed protein product [Malus baccata var. baccata]